jgi:hypothetical protein
MSSPNPEGDPEEWQHHHGPAREAKTLLEHEGLRTIGNDMSRLGSNGVDTLRGNRR